MQERARRLQRTILTTKKAYNQKPFSDSGKGFLLYKKESGMKIEPYKFCTALICDRAAYLKLTPQLEFALTLR